MKLSDVRKKLWPNEVANEEKDATASEVAELAKRKAAEFAKEKIDEARSFSRFAQERAELAESSAKAQIASLQKMYVRMLTECHQEIAELKCKLADKTANASLAPSQEE